MLISFIVLSLLNFIFVTSETIGSSGKVQYSNVGYEGWINYVADISDVTDDTCSCQLAEPVWVEGANSPLSHHLVAHIQGPIKLYKFAFYDVTEFVLGGNNNTFNWTQQAIFDISPESNDHIGINVTFLGHRGDDSPCVGRALSFLDVDSVTETKKNPDPRKFSAELLSNEEFIIYSNFPCQKSGTGKNCGVYRDGIRSLAGYFGQAMLFIFEFTMPTDTNSTDTTAASFDAPSIWIANDNLARITEHYYEDNNCSCLFYGCGAYQIFKTNESNKDAMYSSLQTLQNLSSDNNTRLTSNLHDIVSGGQFARPRNETVRGGVLIDSMGNIVTFLTNNTSFHYELTPDDINFMLSDLPTLGEAQVLANGKSVLPNVTKLNNASSFKNLNE